VGTSVFGSGGAWPPRSTPLARWGLDSRKATVADVKPLEAGALDVLIKPYGSLADAEGVASAKSWPRPARGGLGPRSARWPDLGYTSPGEDATMRTDLVPGSRLPDLELPDHRGRPVRLSALANGYPLVVSFYRGYW